MNETLFVTRNPLILHKLTQLRKEPFDCAEYREVMRHIGLLLASEISLSLPAKNVTFTSRGILTKGTSLSCELVVVPILRTGLVLSEAFQEVVPNTLTGHIGIHRDKNDPSRKLMQYLVSLPDLAGATVLLFDPVIATGDTAIRAIEIIKRNHAAKIYFVSIVISKKSLCRFSKEHPDILFYCAAVDSDLNSEGQVLPGLGSVSERLFGFKTKSS